MSILLQVKTLQKSIRNQPKPGLDNISFEGCTGEFLGIMRRVWLQQNNSPKCFIYNRCSD